MKRVGSGSFLISGYDVSKYQADMGLHHEMKACGDKFCIIKAAEGLSTDPLFKTHWQEAKAQGMITGAYSFFHPKKDAEAQALHFASVVGKLGEGDLGPVLDFETTDGTASIKDADQAYAYLLDVKEAAGKLPIVYGSPYFLENLNLDAKFKRFPLWIANYGVTAPLVPKPWDTWTFWQYTDSKGHLDMDLFNGDIDQLLALTV